MLRRIRGAFGTALVWSAAWSLAGLVVSTVEWMRLRHLGVPAGVVATGTFQWAVAGAIGGGVFALALSGAERHDGGIGALSIRRTAAWGALGGMMLPLCFVVLALTSPVHLGLVATVVWGLSLLGFGSVLGAGSAAGSLILARRAPEHPPHLGQPAFDVTTAPNDAVEMPVV